MLVKIVTTLICAAGIAFYVRFLAALRKEYRPHSSGYWARLRIAEGQGAISELPKRQESEVRAA